jgi:Na+-transporting NADH:ubiquinone oxidoreductase subunit NqrA
MSFLHAISEQERRVLRNIVKKVHLKHHPQEFFTDYEADKLISIIAPDVVERLIKVGVDHKIDEL